MVSPIFLENLRITNVSCLSDTAGPLKEDVADAEAEEEKDVCCKEMQRVISLMMAAISSLVTFEDEEDEEEDDAF